MRESLENISQLPVHDSVYLREELEEFRRGKPIGWEVKGSELKFVDMADLKESDLALFDRIEFQDVDAGNVVILENEIKENFAGATQKEDASRYHFQAFLKNLLMCKWYAAIGDRKNKTLH